MKAQQRLATAVTDERKAAESLGMTWINMPIQDGSFVYAVTVIPLADHPPDRQLPRA